MMLGMSRIFVAAGFVAAASCFASATAAQVISKEWGQCSGGEGRNPDVIITGCTAVIQANNDPDRRLAVALNNRGVAYKAKGDFDHALQDYDLALRLDPYAANHYNNRGVIYRIKGDFARAVEDYEKAIELKPDYIAAYYNRALAYLDMGHWIRLSPISISCFGSIRTMSMHFTDEAS
jgi:tetratricopeptide (TPR) repeat protein